MILKGDAKFGGKRTCASGNFHRLKNNDFVLESKMVELNKNNNSKQLNQQDAVRNFILPWKEMNSTIN